MIYSYHVDGGGRSEATVFGIAHLFGTWTEFIFNFASCFLSVSNMFAIAYRFTLDLFVYKEPIEQVVGAVEKHPVHPHNHTHTHGRASD